MSEWFQSTRSARSATRCHAAIGLPIIVSIHALRKERDMPCTSITPFSAQFQSTRSARSATTRGVACARTSPFQSTRSARSATGEILYMISLDPFQSTRSARSATRHQCRCYPCTARFNPRAPQGARPWFARDFCQPVYVSIHALRKERDRRSSPLPPCPSVSIHALRKERDRRGLAAHHH